MPGGEVDAVGAISRQKAEARAKRQEASVVPSPEGLVAAQPLQGNFGRDLANWLFPVYQLVILGGFLVLRYGNGTPPGEPNAVKALFAAVNAATLSGFADVDNAARYTPIGKGVLLVMMICGSLFTMLVGGLAVIRILRLRYTDKQLIMGTLLVQLIAMGVGTMVLQMAGGFNFQHALFQATAAFGNCGLSLSPGIGVGNPGTQLVILPLAFIGGLGIPVIMEIYHRLTRREPISKNTVAVLELSAGVYLLAMAALCGIAFVTASGAIDAAAVRGIISESSTAVLQSRTLGLELVSMHSLPGVAQWVLVLVMAIGGASGGTAGGIKVNTLRAMYDGIKKTLRGENAGRIFGIASAWVGMYIGIVLVGVLLLTYVLHDAAVDVPAAAISAASNVGLTATRLPSNNRGLLYALCAIMLLGRMAPLMVLWWTAETTRDAEIAVA